MVAKAQKKDLVFLHYRMLNFTNVITGQKVDVSAHEERIVIANSAPGVNVARV
jgi:hypothetical protein